MKQQDNGWIKIHRSIQEKGYYTKSEYIHLWVHLLMKANHKEKEFWFNGKNVKVKRGQLVTGRKVLSQETGISESKVERILKTFISEQQIKQQTNNRNRLISILNYEQYQKSEQPTNNNWTTTEQQLNTNKNDKNIKEVFIGWAEDLDLDKEKVLVELRIAYLHYKKQNFKDKNGKEITDLAYHILKNWKSFRNTDDFRKESTIVKDNSPLN